MKTDGVSKVTIAILVIASMTLFAASETTGTVSGTVTRAGVAVAGVKIAIESASDSAYGATAYTGDDGGFRFAGAPLGTVKVTAYDGQDVVLVAVEVELTHADEAITLRLEIAP